MVFKEKLEGWFKELEDELRFLSKEVDYRII